MNVLVAYFYFVYEMIRRWCEGICWGEYSHVTHHCFRVNINVGKGLGLGWWYMNRALKVGSVPAARGYQCKGWVYFVFWGLGVGICPVLWYTATCIGLLYFPGKYNPYPPPLFQVIVIQGVFVTGPPLNKQSPRPFIKCQKNQL